MTNLEKLELRFVQEKETKNTVRYKEEVEFASNTPFVGVLYLRREAVQALGNPGSLVVTIEAGD